jgi:prolyl-tRNA synthetase
MRYSKLFGKTNRGDVGGSQLISHQLLIRGGFIAESTAGRYYFLPLGWRVHEKIRSIIKSEMDASGAQEMITPTLHPLSLWKETNRTSSVGFELMTIKDQREFEFALGGTAEEMFVDVVRKSKLSYRDLPFNVYQFSTKFRDELRARGGLLRVREFIMKDAYSFDPDEASFKKEYAKMAAVYSRIFKELGLTTIQVEADNGYIGGEYCHEFQVESAIGEGRFFVTADGTYAAHEDVAQFQRLPINSDESEKKMEIIAQPEWVQTMEDNVKQYQKPKAHFLKNVVYKDRLKNEVIIAVICGDLDVNKVKLEHALNAVGQLVEATDADLTHIGTRRGYVHSWGHKGARYIGDLSLTSVKNFIGGQKEDSTDSINVNYGRDFECEILVDIAMAQAGFLAENGQPLIEKRGIEVGNIFQLGYHYSKKMKNANFIDRDGKEKPYYMGCYGIGIGRTLATIVEIHHDDRGMLWPKAIAPFQAHLISLSGGEEKAKTLYQELIDQNIEVLWDDRDVSAGVKFADADLIGVPVRLVVSAKTQERVEVKLRNETQSRLVDSSEIKELL